VALDRYYARNWSVWLDIKILFQAIGAVTKLGDTR
jgi:lipopolysaccharide/colanic/teichoic acid biosynthesis glycosyltransferase